MEATGDMDTNRLTYGELGVGDTFENGTKTLTEDDIVSFASEYDPQPFHLDHDAGEASMFDGLIASGLHTFSVCNRLATEVFFSRVEFMGGRGIDDLRWHRPVRPGDTLSVSVEVASKRASESIPDRGYVDVEMTGRNQNGETVITWTALAMLERSD